MSDSSPTRKRKRSPSRISSRSSSRSRSRSRSRSDRSPPRKRRDRSRSRDRRRSRSRSNSRDKKRNDSRRDDRNIKSEPNRDDRRNDRNNRDNGRRDNRNNNKDDTSQPFFKKRSHDVGEESDIPESQMQWGKANQAPEKEEEPTEKEQPNFKPSGALDREQKTIVNGVELNYFEPKDSKVPTKVYVLYPFKGNESLEPLYLRKSSFFLLGRDRTIVDIPLDHPSCSKQHAVIQFRQRTMENEFGEKKAIVRPYIIDLKSTNGTHLNGTRIDDSRYFELKHKDVLKFGFSSREFVFMDESAV